MSEKSRLALLGPTGVPSSPIDLDPGGTLERPRGERGIGAGEYDGRGILRRLRAETHRTVLHAVRPRLRGDLRSAACQLSFGNRSSAACRLFGDRRSAAGRLFFDSRSAAGRLSFDRRSASGSLSYFTSSALPLCADWHARTRARISQAGKMDLWRVF